MYEGQMTDTRLVQQRFNTLKSKPQTYMMSLNPTNWVDCIPLCMVGLNNNYSV